MQGDLRRNDRGTPGFLPARRRRAAVSFLPMSDLPIQGVDATPVPRRLRMAASGTLGPVEPRPWAFNLRSHVNWYRKA